MQDKSLNTNLLSSILFGLTALIYFGIAAYSYFYKIEGEVFTNIGLGIMFLSLGLVFKLDNKEK